MAANTMLSSPAAARREKGRHKHRRSSSRRDGVQKASPDNPEALPPPDVEELRKARTAFYSRGPDERRGANRSIIPPHSKLVSSAPVKKPVMTSSLGGMSARRKHTSLRNEVRQPHEEQRESSEHVYTRPIESVEEISLSNDERSRSRSNFPNRKTSGRASTYVGPTKDISDLTRGLREPVCTESVNRRKVTFNSPVEVVRDSESDDESADSHVSDLAQATTEHTNSPISIARPLLDTSVDRDSKSHAPTSSLHRRRHTRSVRSSPTSRHRSIRAGSSKRNEDTVTVAASTKPRGLKSQSAHDISTSSTRRSRHIRAEPKSRDEDPIPTSPPTTPRSRKSVSRTTSVKRDVKVECLTCSSEVSTSKSARLRCDHVMCNECLVRVFNLSVTDPQHMPPKCCTQDLIPLRHVEKLFDDNFKRLWNRKFQEFSTRNRIYCPNRNCGQWIKPKYLSTDKSNGRKYAQCKHCDTKVCVACNGKWHVRRDCPKDNATKEFVEMAKEAGWQTCYSCKAMVELKEGCNHMTCRCKAEFCMICGAKWKTCDCPWFNHDQLPQGGANIGPQPIPHIYRYMNNEPRIHAPAAVPLNLVRQQQQQPGYRARLGHYAQPACQAPNRHHAQPHGGAVPPYAHINIGLQPTLPQAFGYQQELETRRIQEQLDEEFARRLQFADEDDMPVETPIHFHRPYAWFPPELGYNSVRQLAADALTGPYGAGLRMAQEFFGHFDDDRERRGLARGLARDSGRRVHRRASDQGPVLYNERNEQPGDEHRHPLIRDLSPQRLHRYDPERRAAVMRAAELAGFGGAEEREEGRIGGWLDHVEEGAGDEV